MCRGTTTLGRCDFLSVFHSFAFGREACFMREAGGQKMLKQGLTILVLSAVAAGCNGSGSTTSASSSPSGSVAPTSSGSSSSSGGTSTTMLFEQPQEGGIASHFVVPLSESHCAAAGVFALVLWQANPFTSNGQLVATGWDAGSQTGFTPAVRHDRTARLSKSDRNQHRTDGGRYGRGVHQFAGLASVQRRPEDDDHPAVHLCTREVSPYRSRARKLP